MDWILDNWMLIALSILIITMILINYRTRNSFSVHAHGNGHEHGPEEDAADKSKKGGHGCCG